jgi:hypothetical protein
MIVEAAKGVMCVTSKHKWTLLVTHITCFEHYIYENEHKFVLKLRSFEAKDLEQGCFWKAGLGAECVDPNSQNHPVWGPYPTSNFQN